MVYALGRGLSASDMPAIRRVVRDASARGYRFSVIVGGIVGSPAFQMRIKMGDERTPGRLAAANR
jgi:hypothetical protein